VKQYLLAAALSIPTAAHGQGWQHPADRAVDEVTLEVHSSTFATVAFYNADPPNSAAFPPELVNGDLTVGIHVSITMGPETLVVTPPEGWVAIPAEISVADGDTGTVELRRGEYLGF